jgi:hypothetical protein
MDASPMDPSRRLRYYASLKPWLGATGCSLGFVVLGVLMYLAPRATHPEDRFMAVICVVFFGLGVVLFPIYAVRDRRAPLLTLTPAGIQTRYMGAGHQIVSWADVTTLRIERGKQWRKNTTPQLYLIARGRHGALSRHPDDWDEVDEAVGAEAKMPHTLIMQPLGQLLATHKATRMESQCQELLDEIAVTFAPELELYQITVEREILTL